MTQQEIKIKIKYTNDKVFDISCLTEWTVLMLKEEIAKQQQDMKAQDMKLIFKGKILSNNELLETYKVENGISMHLVVSKHMEIRKLSLIQYQIILLTSFLENNQQQQQSSNNNNVPTNMSAGQGHNPMMNMGGMQYMPSSLQNMDPDNIQELMNNPEFQQAYQSLMSSPQQLQLMIEQNPYLKSMVDSNPQLKMMLSNPQFLQMMSNPQFIQQTLQMQQQLQQGGGLGGLGMNPMMGGLGGMGNMQQQQQQNQQQSQQQNSGQQQQQVPMFNPMFGMFGNLGQQNQQQGSQQQSSDSQGQNQQQQQNPQQNPMQNLFQMMQNNPAFMNMGMGGFPMMGGNLYNQQQNNQPPEERFKDQLVQLEVMGFTNKNANIQALQAAHGNVEVAVERLLGMMGDKI